MAGPDSSSPQHGGKEPAFPIEDHSSVADELRRELIAERRRAAELQARLTELATQKGESATRKRKSAQFVADRAAEREPSREPTSGSSKEADDTTSAPRSPSPPQKQSPVINSGANEICSSAPLDTEMSAVPSVHSGPDDLVEPQLLSVLPSLPAFGTEGFVPLLLTATEQLLGSEDVIPAVLAWLESYKALHKRAKATPNVAPNTQQFKFGDGIDGVRPFGVVRKVSLYAKEYIPHTNVWGMVEGLARWCTPKGLAWPTRAIEDLMRNCRVASSRLSTCQEGNQDEILVPLYVYTSALYNRPLWAIWLSSKSQWRELSRGHLLEAAREQANAQGRDTIRIDRDVCGDIAQALMVHVEEVSTTLHPQSSLPHGFSVFHVTLRSRRSSRGKGIKAAAEATGGDAPAADRKAVTLMRYTAGKGELSPLADSVAWVSTAEESFGNGFWSFAHSRTPPPGILEYLESRPRGETWDGAGWSVVPVGAEGHAKLISECYAEPNQNRYNPGLHEKLTAVLEHTPPHGLTEAQRKAMDAKLEEDGSRPLPQSIVHALELQELCYGGRDFVIGLSGFPRVIVDMQSMNIMNVYRVYHEHDEQPYLLLNSTMRAVQDGSAEAWLDVSPKAGTHVSGRYLARLPGSELRHVDDPHRTVRWDPVVQCWMCGLSTRLNNSDTKLQLGTWMLDALRPMMFFLDRALAGIPQEDTTVKSYRGLADAMLPHEMYHLGALVVWGSFSSSSTDQATATWFATQGGSAAVFTLRGRSCRMIAPWSRFAREMEWLYPAGCCFQVKTMLTEDQQQILGREELQLYEVDEVDEVEALTIFVTAHINAAITRDDEGFAKVSQLVGVIQPLLSKDIGGALLCAVQPDRPFILEPEGVEMSVRLREIGQGADPPVDTDDILDRALLLAARDGNTRAIPNLIAVGASCQAQDESGLRALEVAMRSGHVDTARCLLTCGASRSIIDDTDRATKSTILHRMAAAGEEQAVMCLLALGADPRSRDVSGRTPAMCAYDRGHKAIVRLLNPEENLPNEVLEEYWAATHWRSDYGEVRARYGEGSKEVRAFAVLTQKRVPFWGPDYSPPGVWDMVCDMAKWDTPIGPAWSERAAEDLLVNCRMMDTKHSQGYPSEVVVPVFVYTTTLYKHDFWASWVPEEEKQMAMGGWKVVSKQLLRACVGSDGQQLVLPPSLLSHKDGDELCFVCGRSIPVDITLPTSLPQTATGVETMHCSPPDQEYCRLAGLWEQNERVRLPSIGSGKGLSGYGWPNGQCIINFTHSDDAPLRGGVLWLPPPNVLFGDGPHRLGSLPSSGILEYIFSRPVGAHLEQRSLKGTMWRCAPAVTLAAAVSLVADCAACRNQSFYDVDLHKRFEAMLPHIGGTADLFHNRELSTPTGSFSSDPRGLPLEVLHLAAERKLKGRRRPTPEVITHALALQRLEEKGGRRWILGLSGEPRIVVHDESFIASRVYRVCSPFLPSPSEHANNAVRARHLGRKGSVLEVTPNSQSSMVGGQYLDAESWRALQRDELEISTLSRSEKRPLRRAESLDDRPPQSPADAAHVTSPLLRYASPKARHGRSPTLGFSSVLHVATTPSLQVLKRVTAPHHTARWDPVDDNWVITFDNVRYGSWSAKRNGPQVLLPDEAHFNIGTYMLEQVKPLLYYVAQALDAISPTFGTVRLFRAAANVPRELFEGKSVVFWDSITSASVARSVAMSHLAGSEGGVNVFRIKARSARRVSDWSRLSREEEWLVPPQACLQVVDVSKEMGSGIDVFELEEIDDAQALVLYIREVIKRPPPGESTPAYVTQLYRVIAAVEAGSLNTALALTLRPEKPVLHSESGVEVAARCIALGADAGLVAVALREAAREGLTSSVGKLMDLGADPEPTGEKGDTPLELAIRGGHVETVKALVSNVEMLTMTTDLHEPPLHRRAIRGQPLALYTLLKLGAQADLVNSQGKTAAECGHQAEKPFCVYVLKFGSTAPLPPSIESSYQDSIHVVLRTAVENGAVDAVLAMSHLGGDPSIAADANGHTAMHHAARVSVFNSGAGLAAFRTMAVSVGQSHAVRDSARQTPLHEAAENGHAAVVAALLQAGADLHALDIVGNTPLALSTSDEVSLYLQRAMAQAHAEAVRRIQTLPPDVSLALVRLVEVLSESSKTDGDVSASEIAMAGFGGTLRAVRNLLLLREQGKRAAEQVVHQGRQSVLRTDEVHIPVDELKARFVSWGPPDENDGQLMERIQTWLGNLGVLDGQNALRWLEGREQQSRATTMQDEGDARRGLTGKLARFRRDTKKRLTRGYEGGGFMTSSLPLSNEQRLEDRVNAFWTPFVPVWAVVYLAAVAHTVVSVPLGLTFHNPGSAVALRIVDAIYWFAVVVCVLTYNWRQWMDPARQPAIVTNPTVRIFTCTGFRHLCMNSSVDNQAVALLVLHVLAAIPIDVGKECSGHDALLRANKVLGLVQVPACWAVVKNRVLGSMNPAHLLFVRTCVIMAVCLHILTCVYTEIALASGGVAYDDQCVMERSTGSYPYCMLAALSLLSGWMRRWPVGINDGEVIVFTAFGVCGVGCLAWYIGTVSKLLDMWSPRAKEYADALHTVDEWLMHTGAEKHVRRDVERYFKFLWRTERGTGVHCFDFVVQEVAVHMPRLAHELNIALDRQVLREVPFFANLDTDLEFTHEVVQSLQLHLGVPGSVLCEEGAAATCMFFIASGVVEIYVDGFLAQGEYHDGRRVATLTAGDYFGEVALLQETARSASAVSLSNTRMYVLERGHAFDRIRKYPGAFAALLDAMGRRKRSLELIKPKRLGRPKRLVENVSVLPSSPRKEGGAIVSPSLSPPTLAPSASTRSFLNVEGSRKSAAEGAHLWHLEQLLRNQQERRLSDTLESDDSSPSSLLPATVPSFAVSPTRVPQVNSHYGGMLQVARGARRESSTNPLSRPTSKNHSAAGAAMAPERPLQSPVEVIDHSGFISPMQQGVSDLACSQSAEPEVQTSREPSLLNWAGSSPNRTSVPGTRWASIRTGSFGAPSAARPDSSAVTSQVLPIDLEAGTPRSAAACTVPATVPSAWENRASTTTDLDRRISEIATTSI
eukprot:TRINITY_DN5476_c0_g1_i1.p1 TRINITY_DN5476_c0_g1~~TRINITY_DN5476_c0_g1_i1.p1  ORF type:complete len:3068 (+),score=846.44 TRINITY_DN5476_c0_g1_i1:204-9407(+)